MGWDIKAPQLAFIDEEAFISWREQPFPMVEVVIQPYTEGFAQSKLSLTLMSVRGLITIQSTTPYLFVHAMAINSNLGVVNPECPTMWIP